MDKNKIEDLWEKLKSQNKISRKTEITGSSSIKAINSESKNINDKQSMINIKIDNKKIFSEKVSEKLRKINIFM